MSLSTVAQLWRDPLLLEGHWWLLGMLWAPALLVALLAVRWRPRGAVDLLALSAGLALVFFLCRAWVSESNVVLVLAPVLILGAVGRVDGRLFTALWGIALAFTVANASPVQLLWVPFPTMTEQVLTVVRNHSEVTLTIRALLVVAWQIAGWWTVVACLRRPRRAAEESGATGHAEAIGQSYLAGTSGSAGPTREALP